MSGLSSIEWTDATWNPVTGCTKVSAGCKNCYAERIFHRPYPGREFTDVQTHPDKLDWPRRWRGSPQAKAEGRASRIFVVSMGDPFHKDVPDAFLDAMFATMVCAQHHIFQLLTKRAERMCNYFTAGESHNDARRRVQDILFTWHKDEIAVGLIDNWPLLPNVWLGVSVEDQTTVDERIPLLLQTSAAVRFISYEPALGPVDLFRCFKNGVNPLPHINWVIAGGESGPGARPSHPNWFRRVRSQCLSSRTPFFFKQWGQWGVADNSLQVTVPIKDLCLEGHFTAHLGGATQKCFGWGDGTISAFLDKKLTGRLLDGREWNEFPKQS